jgi:hypothetical protein
VARRRQGVARDLEGVTGKVPGKEERTGAHWNDGSTMRRCQRRQAAAFIGGEGDPVVAGEGDEVLQLGRGEGVRDLQEISGIGRLGRSSPGSGGDGGARPESVRERGLSVAGGGGPGAGSGGEARVLERKSRRGVGTGERVEQHERGASGSTAARQKGKRREKMGSRAWGCHATRGCRGAWPRPADVTRQQPERGAHG